MKIKLCIFIKLIVVLWYYEYHCKLLGQVSTCQGLFFKAINLFKLSFNWKVHYKIVLNVYLKLNFWFLFAEFFYTFQIRIFNNSCLNT